MATKPTSRKKAAAAKVVSSTSDLSDDCAYRVITYQRRLTDKEFFLPVEGRVVGGYRVFPSAAGPQHLTRDQIRKAIEGVYGVQTKTVTRRVPIKPGVRRRTK